MRKMYGNGVMLLLLLTATFGFGCTENASDPDTEEQEQEEEEQQTGLPPGYEKFTNGTTVTLDGDFVVIQAQGVPNHGSPYFDQSDSRYEAYNGTNPDFRLNPNLIAEQTLTYRIPVTPTLDPTHPATPLGAIGVSLNGVPFYNQYAAMREPLTSEINSFDQYNGHPQQMGGYHYHIEPLYLTSTEGRDGLLGFLLDGYPVYGPIENGTLLTSSDLDDYHGHEGPTAEYPEGIYHYHITADDPYLNGAGFYGVPGTVSR